MVTLDQNLDWESYFRVNPSKAVSLFLTAAKLEAGVDFRLISVLKKIKIKVTVDMKKEFLLLLAHKGKIAHLLLQMHEAGLLEGFLPGLRKADERFAGGGHVFALSQHLLNLIDSLENYSLYIDWDKERPQEVDGILLPLRIAALVHDLSKEDAFMVYGYPHPLSGADVFVPETLRQLIVGIPPKKKDEIIKMVQWLVWHHQDLSARARWTDSKGKETEAQRQSLYQDLLYFVSIGLNKEKLLALYFLTLADGRSVNPDRFSIDNSSKKYINTLVKHLHGFVSLKDPAARRAVVKEWQVRAGAEREKLAEELTKGLLALDKENFKLANQPGLKVDQDRLFEYIKQENVMRHLVGQFLTGAPDFLKQNTNPRVISKYIALMAVAPFLGKGKGFAVAGDLTTSFSDMFELAVSYHGNRKGLVADITTAVASFGVSIINGQFRAIQPDPNKPDQVTFDYIAGYVKESPDWPETINYLYQNYHDVYKFLETKLKNNLTEDMFYLEAGEKSGLPIKNIRFDNLGRSIEEFAQNIGGQGINVAQHKESLTLFRNTALKVVQKTMLEEFLPWFVRQMVDGNIHWKSLVDWPIIKEYRANQQVIKTQVYFRDVKGQTRMTIKTADRPLLLASVSRILSDRFGVDIAFAPVITTHAGTRDRLLLTYQGEVLSDSMKEEIGALLKVFFSFPVLSYDALVLAAEGALVSKVGSFLKQLNADQAMSSAIAPFVAASKIFLGQMKGARSERKQELVVVLGGLVAGMEDALKDYRDMQTLPQDVGQELFNFRAALIPFLEDEYVKGPVVDLLKRVDVLSKTHTAHAVISTFEELPVVGLEEVQSVKLTEWDYLKLREFRGQLEELNASFFADDKDPGLWVNFLEGHIKELAKAPEGSFVALFSSLITTGAENKEWELRNPLAVISLAINLKINFNEYVLELKRRIANVLVVLDKLEGGVGKNYKRVKTPTSSADMLDPQVIVVDDKAMSAVDKVPGGIDLNPANMAMSVDSRGDLPAVFDLNGIDLSRIEGFSPVIISITPVTSLPVLN